MSQDEMNIAKDDPRPQNTLAWAYTLRHLCSRPSIVFSCSFLPASKDWRHGQGASWAILVDELLEGERDATNRRIHRRSGAAARGP